MENNLLTIVQKLESTSKQHRFEVICEWLDAQQIDYFIQEYPTGKNIVTKPKKERGVLAVASHYDVVTGSPGGNDNGSAIAVCLEVLSRAQATGWGHIQAFFFDEEETGLLGSKAFVETYGIDQLKGIINMELVGMGDRFALWPLNETSFGELLETFESVCEAQNIDCLRFDQIVTNTADHVSFRNAGLNNCFTITCISEADVQVAYHYYKALELEADVETLREIILKAPVFEHYHQPTDLAKYLNETTLQMAADCIWKTFLKM